MTNTPHTSKSCYPLSHTGQTNADANADTDVDVDVDVDVDSNGHANIHYHCIEQAIDYILSHYDEQPSLQKIAKQVHMSPYHFQRVFSEWAGTTPRN